MVTENYIKKMPIGDGSRIHCQRIYRNLPELDEATSPGH
jgi:hypothetical protein